VLVGQTRQDEHRDRRRSLQHGAQRLHALGVREPQVEQHAVEHSRELLPGLRQRPDPLQLDVCPRLEQQLTHQEGIALVVLDEKNPGGARDNAGRRAHTSK
jgi:hypothetical protein